MRRSGSPLWTKRSTMNRRSLPTIEWRPISATKRRRTLQREIGCGLSEREREYNWCNEAAFTTLYL